jgi:ATP-binding cassette subfamily F protein 3
MLLISNLSIHFANRYLFEKISFPVNPGDRIGLIGRNGSGKTTLLNIIAGSLLPEEGTITKSNNYTIGYLPQESIIESDKILFDEVSSALSEIKELEKNIKNIAEELSRRNDYDSTYYQKLLQTLSEVNEHFNTLGGNSIEAEIEYVLTGLGFLREEFHRPVSEFSGGWQMRSELAKILLRKPDCILLDEPTNHLDLDSILWLRNFLHNYKGSAIIVSHDREFLDNVTNRTIEISGGKIYDLNKPYSEFAAFRREQHKQQLAAFKEQQRQIAETERFIERFRYKATLASRVQSKIKQLEKIDRIELEEDDLSSIKFRFPGVPHSGKVVAETISLSKSYSDKIVLNEINFAIEKGEKIAFVGKNGEGKTTFSRILAGIEDYTGTLRIGYNIQTGFYSQQQAELLYSDSTVFEIIDNAATGDMRTQVRNLLGAFLFSGEAVNKKVKVLSGGEKSRLALAQLLLQPVNFLILDEPTNHLDMVAKDVLKKALLQFTGSLIIVSHDIEFLRGLTFRTVFFKNKQIFVYPGNIDEFLENQKFESINKIEESSSNIEKTNETKSSENTKTLAQAYREEQKQRHREESRIKRLIQKCENEIDKIENKIAELEFEFSKPDFTRNVKNSKTMNQEFDSLRTALDDKMEEWTNLQIELENCLKHYL